MSASRHTDVQCLAQPSTPGAGSPSADRLGGLDDLLNQAMDLSTDAEKVSSKPDFDESMDEDTNKLLDFDDFLVTSKSRVKIDTSGLNTVAIPLETVEEIVGEEEPILFGGKKPGESNESPSVSSGDMGNKKYKLFVGPDMMECVKLCKTFIGQGTTVCMNTNCSKNHRQKRSITVAEEQLFVAKSKDVVFAEPTLNKTIDPLILHEWKTLSLTISQWREKFEIVRKVAKKGTDVKPENVKDEESKMKTARDYKTPLKRRVRESLEDDDLEDYEALEVEDSLNWDKVKHYFNKVDKALQANQSEHQKFRSCQIELEDNFLRYLLCFRIQQRYFE